MIEKAIQAVKPALRCLMRGNTQGEVMKKFIKIYSLCLFLFLLLLPMTAYGGAMSKKALVLTAKTDGTSVNLKWKKRNGADGYQVCLYNAKGKCLERVTTKKCSYAFQELDMGKKYGFRVRAYCKNGSRKTYASFSTMKKVTIPRIETTSTLKKLLKTALEPVGSTLYVWGGGWNKEDTGAGKAAVTIGVSPKWKTFFQKQDANYDYQQTRYQIEDGLDCSGYIGWCIYNILNTKSGKKGYVMKASEMAENFAGRGWGTYKNKNDVKDYRAGDIMSSSGHVYMVVGQCSDGSVVLLHASPPGVQLCGTPSASGKAESRAVVLARTYMKRCYPEYYRRYPNCSRGNSYLTDFHQMRWDLSGNSVMSDPDGYRNMTADRILKNLFS